MRQMNPSHYNKDEDHMDDHHDAISVFDYDHSAMHTERSFISNREDRQWNENEYTMNE